MGTLELNTTRDGNQPWHLVITRPYTRQHQSRAGGQGQYGIWAGAATHICSPLNSKHPKRQSDFGRTDGPMDRRTDIVKRTRPKTYSENEASENGIHNSFLKQSGNSVKGFTFQSRPNKNACKQNCEEGRANTHFLERLDICYLNKALCTTNAFVGGTLYLLWDPGYPCPAFGCRRDEGMNALS